MRRRLVDFQSSCQGEIGIEPDDVTHSDLGDGGTLVESISCYVMACLRLTLKRFLVCRILYPAKLGRSNQSVAWDFLSFYFSTNH